MKAARVALAGVLLVSMQALAAPAASGGAAVEESGPAVAAPSGKADPRTPAVPGGATLTAPAAAKTAPAPGAPDEGKPSNVDIQVRLLADKLARGVTARSGGGRYETWAVVPFSALGEEVEKKRLGEVVSAQVENALRADHGFVLVERMKLAQLLQEVALGQAGVVDESKAPEFGKMAGADFLVVGSVGQLGDRYVVNARVVEVESSKILASGQVSIEAAGLVALSSDAVVLRTRSDAVFRSLLIPGWGQFYNRQPEKGGVIMFAAGALIIGGATTAVLGSMAESDYRGITEQNPGPCANLARAAFNECVGARRDDANGFYRTSTWLFAGLGAVWVYNVLDAAFFGYSPDASTRSLYGSRLEVLPGNVQVSGSF